MFGSADIPVNNASPTSSLRLRSGRVVPKKKDNKSHASANLTFNQNDEDTTSAFPFLKLPAELRVRIYRFLLHAYDDVCIGILDPDSRAASKATFRSRSPGRNSTTRAKTDGKKTTYMVKATGVHPALLSVNQQIYLEASRIFYSENCFDFCGICSFPPGGSNPAVIPFLEDRSEGSRRLIKQIKFCYALLGFVPHISRSLDTASLDQVFQKNCNYLSRYLQLEHVSLSVFGLIDERTRQGMPYKTYLARLDQQQWIKQLVPLVKNLDSIRIIRRAHRGDDLMRAVQTYLESKMDKASKAVRQSQIVQELADAGAAFEE